LFAQQMAARQQLEEIRRRALPGGVGGPGGRGEGQVIIGPGGQLIAAPGSGFGPQPGEGGEHGTGQYL
jgi:hypothetical protein